MAKKRGARRTSRVLLCGDWIVLFQPQYEKQYGKSMVVARGQQEGNPDSIPKSARPPGCQPALDQCVLIGLHRRDAAIRPLPTPAALGSPQATRNRLITLGTACSLRRMVDGFGKREVT